jgi:ubiquinone/menaquinone biosynthesis C-methylase UbiE
MPGRLRDEFDRWLKPVAQSGFFLDIGCGLGGLLCAAAMRGIPAAGIDNRLSILVIAKKLIEREGGTAILACADARSLPLDDESVQAAVMLDVVEHIPEIEVALGEANRVVMENGVFACSTPNRFSVAPEPHVHLWGVGWLPRKYQTRYVRRARGVEYRGTELKSARELVAMLRRSTQFKLEVRIPEIPRTEIEAARGARKFLARCYNLGIKSDVLGKLFLLIGPFFQITGIKSPSPDIRHQVG